MADICQIDDEMCTNHGFGELFDIPAEIIENILATDSITPLDLLNLSLTCTHLRRICLSNELWKQKLKQRWPSMLHRYSTTSTYHWKNEYKHRHSFGCKLRTLVSQLSPKYYSHEEISKEGFSDFQFLMSQHALAGECLVDELMAIVHDGKPSDNLTEKFYAVKALRFVQQYILKEKISEFQAQPPEKQMLETGAVLIAQWCQPTENVTLTTVCSQLDQLAGEVRQHIEITCPHHPLLGTQVEAQDVTSDLWTTDQSHLVVQALNQVLFATHRFRGNNQSYYIDTNSFIDKVLKLETGIPISLCIVYASVARRLGVVCEPVNFPSHFLLRWKHHPLATREQMYVYIDVFNKGKLLDLEELPRALNVPSSVVNLDDIGVTLPIQVFERMIRNLIAIGRQQGRIGDHLLCLRNALELSILFTPDDFDMRLLLVRVNLHLNINLLEVIDSLQTVQDGDQLRVGMVAYLLNAAQTQLVDKDKEEKQVVVKKRGQKEENVKYSVGLVMKHKRYNYTCVIYGWDPVCEASQEWIVQMGVHHLPNMDKQPFYNVLVEDGTNRYAAEENLEFHEQPSPVPHAEMGRYFMAFQATHYIPNDEKLAEYPDDIQRTIDITRETYSER